MSILEQIIGIKENNQEMIEMVVSKYQNYINTQMKKYNIIDKEECKNIAIINIIKATKKFEIR